MDTLKARISLGLISVILIAAAGCGGGGNSNSNSNSTPAKTTPTVTWATLAAITYGIALSATQLNASASAPGTFVYTPPAGTVLASGSQTLSVVFTPSDTTRYNSATASVTVVVNPVAKVTPTITWAAPAAITYGTALSATQLNATANVPGNFVYSPAAGSIPAAGTQTSNVTFTPTDTVNYNNASASVQLQVNRATPTITWAAPAAISYGTVLSATQLNATANVPGSFVYSPAAGSTPPIGAQTLNVTFTPTDSANYTNASASVQLQVNQATPTITWAPPATIAFGVDLSGVLNATASVPGTFTYSATPSGGSAVSVTASTVLNAGLYTVTAAFSPTDTTNYAQATASKQLTVTAAAGTAVVDFGTPGQIIRGFGGSEAWSSVMPASQINALYGTASGDIGLSIMRLRVAPTTWNSMTKTPDTTSWTAELTNGKMAQDLGATIFASPWSAPAAMKSNSNVNAGSLNTSSYSDYASYLEAYVNYATTQGVNLYAISMQNEPDWNPCPTNCYESMLWTAAQMDTWVANNSSVLTTKLIMPESLNFNPAMTDTALNDPNAVGHIDIVGGHIYGSTPSYYTLAKSLNKDVWMTEHTINLATGETTTMSMADALTAAKDIHDSMSVGQYNAYVYWWMVNSSGNSFYSGLIDASANMTYAGKAMAQYARFVRPGYYRYDATANPATGVYVSAYGGSGHQVIVAINTNTSANTVSFTIQGQTVTSLTPYQTTSSTSVAAQSLVNVSGNAFSYALPAQSITTFVQ